MGAPVGNRIVPDGLAPIAILGVTASGKSSLALDLARRRPEVELVSIDSMQVYRRMDIGTAKPTRAEQAEVRHHVLDLVEPWEPFDLAQFQAAVAAALADIATRGRRAVLVGGTGLYLRAVVDALEIPGQYPEVAAALDAETDTAALHRRLAALDPAAAEKMEPTNRRRVLRALEVTVGSGRLDAHPASPVALIGLRRDRAEIAARIEDRYRRQLTDGFLDEVRALRSGPPISRTAAQALGYRELLAHLDAEALDEPTPTLADAVDLAILRTRQFAVRQERWFRRDDRITWVDPDEALDTLAGIVSTRWTR